MTVKDFDDFLEKWNKNNSSEKINEYLGLTEEQYYKWCDDPDDIQEELDKIKRK